jgi:hypothetical protein
VARTTAGGAAAQTCTIAALTTTDGAVARATAGREEVKVSTVWHEGGAVAAPDSIADGFFHYDCRMTIVSGAVKDASPDNAESRFHCPVRQMWHPGPYSGLHCGQSQS